MKLVNLVMGSIAGGLARYFLAGAVYRAFGTAFPYGTLVVNLIGCFIIGFLAAVAEEKFALNHEMRLLLMIGFCGAFTTFSTFMLETANLLKDGETLRAFMNVALSVVIGFIAFKLGVLTGEII